MTQPNNSPRQNLPAIIPAAPGESRGSSFRIRIVATDGVHIDEHDYVLHQRRPGGAYLLARLDLPDIIEEFSAERLNELYKEGRLSVSHNYHSSRSASGRLNSPGGFLSDLDDGSSTRWSDRLELVDDFIRAERDGDYSRSDQSMKEFVAAWCQARVLGSEGRFGKSVDIRKPPSPSSLRRWLRRYEACDHDPAALIDGYGRSGNRDARLDPEVAEIMATFVEKFQSNLKPSMASLYRAMRAEFRQKHPMLSVPSRNTFERAIKKLDPFEVLAAREGEAVAKRKLYAVRDRVDVTRPLQRVELDEQLIPLQTMLIERGKWRSLPEKLKAGITHDRLWCSKIVDVYSRVVLGFVITRAPSTASALATLRMSLEDKTALAAALGCHSPWDMYGLPELIVTDSGSNFRSKVFRAAVLDLGCSIMIAPAGLPQMRGVMERSFRTDTQLLYSEIPGRSFMDVVEKGEYESEANIAVTIAELAKLIVRNWVDVFHNTPHAGLGGDTPANRWRTGVERFGVLPPPPPDIIRHIFSTPLECRIGNRGIRVAALFYQSKELQKARREVGSKYVLVRVDTKDLGHISVRTEKGWITVPCSTTGFDGVSLFHWKQAQAELRRSYASVAALAEDIVAKAIIDIREEVERLRIESDVPSPIMSSKNLLDFNRDLERGFDMVRPEEPVPQIADAEEYGAKSVKDEDAEIIPVIHATPKFFTE